MTPDPTRHLGLLLIDLQDPFLNAMTDSGAMLRRIRFALAAADCLGIAVAATEQMPEKLGPTNADLAALLPAGCPCFAKESFSALGAPGLREWIRENEIEHLLLAGIETPICVYQTAIEAMGEDLGVTLLSDCVGERRREDRDAVFAQLRAADAHILPSETIFYSLLGGAGHPQFREFTKLVKTHS